MSFVKTDDEAIAPTTNHCNRPTEDVSLAAKTKSTQGF